MIRYIQLNLAIFTVLIQINILIFYFININK